MSHIVGICMATNNEDEAMIRKIVARAVELHETLYNATPSRLSLSMDLTIAHNHQPLDLTRLYAASDSEFAHDVFGIRRHLDRETGKLPKWFSPRFLAAPVAETPAQV